MGVVVTALQLESSFENLGWDINNGSSKVSEEA
jgi:hypothetical protein